MKVVNSPAITTVKVDWKFETLGCGIQRLAYLEYRKNIVYQNIIMNIIVMV